MTFCSPIGGLLSGIQVPMKLQRFIGATSREGAAAIALPEGAVIVGRSAAAWKRGKFMEFQERAPEEVVVAAIWLFGVSTLQKIFDKLLKPGLFKSTGHLSPEIAWNMPGLKRTHVDLTAQEMFTRNADEIGKFLKMKGARWLFSVGLAVGCAAYVIPKLNQWKTNLILKHWYNQDENHAKKQAASTAHQPQSRATAAQQRPPVVKNPAPPTAPERMTFAEPIRRPAMPPVAPSMPGLNSWPTQMPGSAPLPQTALPIWTPGGVPARQTRPPFFAGSGAQSPAPSSGLKFAGASPADLVQVLGHMVDQTPYGHILAVDAGITGGRGYVASKRSVFETVEVVFRDAVSLYFYILFAPHMMKALGAVIDPAFKTHIALDPTVAQQMNKLISERLADRVRLYAEHNPQARDAILAAFESGNVPKDLLMEVLQGSQRMELLEPMGWLKGRMRTAAFADGERTFMDLLAKELDVYLAKANDAGTPWAQEINDYLAPRLSNQQVGTQDVDHLLAAIQQGQGPFSKMNGQQRTNLTTAIKQAFRHTAGLQVDLSRLEQDLPEIARVMSQLPADEQAALKARVIRSVKVGSVDQANSMFRRGLNVARDFVPSEAEGFLEGVEQVADWIDKAASQHMTLDELIGHELDDIHQALQRSQLPDEVKDLLKTRENVTAKTLTELEQALAKQVGDRQRGKTYKLLQQLQAFQKLFGPAAADESQTLAWLAEENIRQSARKLADYVPEGSAKSLLSHYDAELEKLLGGKVGRLFSLAISDTDENLVVALKEMLQGGLPNDRTFIRLAQEMLGHFKPDSRHYHNPGRETAMRRSVSKYLEKLASHFSRDEAQSGIKALSGKLEVPHWKQIMKGFFNKHNVLHTGARLVALAGTMYCLGILVPKLQYALTRKLTGKDENPGIASAESAHGVKGAPESESAKGSSVSTALPDVAAGPPLNRDNFQAFKLNHA